MPKSKKDLPIQLPTDLIPELLTASEIRMLKQRLRILELLKNNLSYRAIAHEIGVGTDTVVRMAKKLKASAVLKDHYKSEKKEPSKWVFGEKN